MSADTNEVLGLLVRRVATVMAVDAEGIEPDARLDEDLHADSLDLVEMVEGVEADLRERGYAVSLPEDELIAAETIADAAAAIARHAHGGA